MLHFLTEHPKPYPETTHWQSLLEGVPANVGKEIVARVRMGSGSTLAGALSALMYGSINSSFPTCTVGHSEYPGLLDRQMMK